MKGETGFYDTNVLAAYLFREEGRVHIAKQVIMNHIVKGISIITIHELCTLSIRFNLEDRFNSIKEQLEKIFKIVSLDQESCLIASHLRKEYELPEIDSLILASAIRNKYRHFYTFDRDFEKLDEITIDQTTIHYLR